ncbi:hypothetical protein CULT_2120001 [[Clostridium] ultunense Esp]|nr:hypothetical protein CULT_2120001 [[Clostridium] ultunense Esp]
MGKIFLEKHSIIETLIETFPQKNVYDIEEMFFFANYVCSKWINDG